MQNLDIDPNIRVLAFQHSQIYPKHILINILFAETDLR